MWKIICLALGFLVVSATAQIPTSINTTIDRFLYVAHNSAPAPAPLPVDDTENCFGSLETKIIEIDNQLQALTLIHQGLMQNVQKSNSKCIEMLNKPSPQSCADAMGPNDKYGYYEIAMPQIGLPKIRVLCERKANDKNPWLIILRRVDDSVTFRRSLHDFIRGFGKLETNFFFGLENMHKLTRQRNYELVVTVADQQQVVATARYTAFEISDQSDGYKIKRLGTYSGNAGDALSYHADKEFCRYDEVVPNPENTPTCFHQEPTSYWWHTSCDESNLNGEYVVNSNGDAQGMLWYTWKSRYFGLAYAEMAIRPMP